MTTKEKVLKLLQSRQGYFLSGQAIAEELFVTRAGIWKAIKSLRDEGYDIEAVTNRGYRLKVSNVQMDIANISRKLENEWRSIKVIYYDEIDSTNDEARRLDMEDYGAVLVIAGSQSAGRGRRGRRFYSPKHSGIYMSLVLRQELENVPTTNITGICAVAVANAIDRVFFKGDSVTRIKWVNDIFLEERKVAGILTEQYIAMEDREDNRIIIGMGINISKPETGFPKEISKIAGAVVNGEVPGIQREELIIEIVKGLRYYLKNKEESLRTYREKSIVVGGYVKINSFAKMDRNRMYAKVNGITEDYHLAIEYEDGTLDELSSGEVSVVKY